MPGHATVEPKTPSAKPDTEPKVTRYVTPLVTRYVTLLEKRREEKRRKQHLSIRQST